MRRTPHARRAGPRPAVALRPANEPFGRTDGERRHRRDPRREVEGGVETVSAAGTTVVTRPGGERLSPPHRPAGQDRAPWPADPPDGPGQPLRAAGAGHHADPDLRLPERRVVAGHDEVARHRQLAAAAQGETRAPRRSAGTAVAQMRSQAPNRRSATSRSGVWSASSTMSAPAAKARSPAPVRTIARVVTVGVERLEGRGQLIQQVEVQGVERVGSVDGQEGDAIGPGRARLDADEAGGRLDVGQRGAPSRLVPLSIHGRGTS